MVFFFRIEMGIDLKPIFSFVRESRHSGVVHSPCTTTTILSSRQPSQLYTLALPALPRRSIQSMTFTRNSCRRSLFFWFFPLLFMQINKCVCRLKCQCHLGSTFEAVFVIFSADDPTFVVFGSTLIRVLFCSNASIATKLIQSNITSNSDELDFKALLVFPDI